MHLSSSNFETALYTFKSHFVSPVPSTHLQPCPNISLYIPYTITPHLHSLVCHSIQSTTNLHLDAHIASFLTLIAQSLHGTNTISMSNDVIIPHPRTDTSFQKSLFSNPVAHLAYTHKILTVLLHSRTGFESLWHKDTTRHDCVRLLTPSLILLHTTLTKI